MRNPISHSINLKIKWNQTWNWQTKTKTNLILLCMLSAMHLATFPSVKLFSIFNWLKKTWNKNNEKLTEVLDEFKWWKRKQVFKIQVYFHSLLWMNWGFAGAEHTEYLNIKIGKCKFMMIEFGSMICDILCNRFHSHPFLSFVNMRSMRIWYKPKSCEWK